MDQRRKEQLAGHVAALEQAVAGLRQAVSQIRFGRPKTQQALIEAQATFAACVVQWQKVWTETMASPPAETIETA